MTPDVSAPSDWWMSWRSIDWKAVHAKVRRLQVRIAKAVREGHWGTVTRLQRILTRSLHARLLAVRRVTTNKGKRTPGVDGVVWETSWQKICAVLSLRKRGYRPQPLRRIYIPKKSGKRRPLGIPTMMDRAMQALYKLALEPIAETLADGHSYGFRPRRSAADALGQCYILLAKKVSPAWIWEADIEACFDNISHDWTLDNVPVDKSVLHKWLKSGYMEDTVLYPTEKGTPQGGLISPVLANMALDGLEEIARGAVPKRVKRRSTRSKVHVVRYADDFIVTAHSRELLEEKVIPAIKSFLEARGLNISEMKSKITHIRTGFDFLGAHVRKYGSRGKFLIHPSKDSELRLVRNIRELVQKSWSARTEDLIRRLNSIIRGWANYFRPYCSSQCFRRIDGQVFDILWRWARHRHRNKGARWVAARYFRSRPNCSWIFYTTIRDRYGLQRSLELVKASYITIRRHPKIRSEANVYEPEYASYFAERRWKQREARMEDRRRWRRWKRGELEYAT